MKRLTFAPILVCLGTSLIMHGQFVTHLWAAEPDVGQAIPFESFALSKELKARIGDQEAELYGLVRAHQCEEAQEIVAGWKNRYPEDKELQIFGDLSIADCRCARSLSSDPGEEAVKELKGATVILEETADLAMQDPERFNSQLAHCYYLLATTYKTLGEYDRAFEVNKKLALDYNGLGTGRKTNLLAAGGLNRIGHIYREAGWPVEEGVSFFEKVYDERYRGHELGLVALTNIYILQVNGGLVDDALKTLKRIDQDYPDNNFTKPNRQALLRK